MSEPDFQLVPTSSAQLALAKNHLALLNKILPPAIRGPIPGRPWEIEHIGLDMVWISPGKFTTMLLPVTEVILTHGYWLGRTAVTQEQYQSVMGDNPSYFRDGNAPVELLSWDDAILFCKKLTEQERTAGRLSRKMEYALPTQAQWEYAARAGITGYYGGDLERSAWHRENSGGTTHPVGMKQSNAWGLYDMHGNVWEWCRDWYERYPGGSVINLTGPTSGSERAVRGGSWLYEADCFWCDIAHFASNFRSHCIGFRLAIISSE